LNIFRPTTKYLGSHPWSGQTSENLPNNTISYTHYS